MTTRPVRRHLALLLATALAGSALLGCSSATDTTTVSVTAGAAAAQAPAGGSALSPAEFAAAVKRPDTLLLDVRTPAEFAAGHLPGAVNVDWEGADYLGQLSSYDKTKTYALYCRSSNRSGQAMAAMRGAGFTNVYHLDGGINAWQAAGGEVVTG